MSGDAADLRELRGEVARLTAENAALRALHATLFTNLQSVLSDLHAVEEQRDRLQARHLRRALSTSHE